MKSHLSLAVPVITGTLGTWNIPKLNLNTGIKSWRWTWSSSWATAQTGTGWENNNLLVPFTGTGMRAIAFCLYVTVNSVKSFNLNLYLNFRRGAAGPTRSLGIQQTPTPSSSRSLSDAELPWTWSHLTGRNKLKFQLEAVALRLVLRSVKSTRIFSGTKYV